MIEMLGVLAIIGVLSAGGIMGYNQAMSAYTFNKFVKDVQTTVSATVQAFPRPKRHSEKVAINLPSQLKALGVLSEDLYKTAENPTASPMIKNPFTKKYDWLLALIEEPPYTTVVVHSISAVPKNICIRIMTYNWSGIAPKYYYVMNRTKYPNIGEARAHQITSPVSIATAESECNYESNAMHIGFMIHVNF